MGCNIMERNCQVVEIEAIDGDRREPSDVAVSSAGYFTKGLQLNEKNSTIRHQKGIF